MSLNKNNSPKKYKSKTSKVYRNESIFLRTLLIVIPIIILTVIVIVVFFSFKSCSENKINSVGGNNTTASESKANYTNEQQALLTLVINAANPIETDFVPTLSEFRGVSVNILAIDNLRLLLQEAEDNGILINVESGYVSYEQQDIIFNKAVEDCKLKNNCSLVKARAQVIKTIPEAGHSEQQTGLLLKFSSKENTDFGQTKAYRWLDLNSVRFGFVLRYTDSETSSLDFTPDMFRFVGVENAYNMRAYNMNLEEYALYISKR